MPRAGATPGAAEEPEQPIPLDGEDQPGLGVRADAGYQAGAAQRVAGEADVRLEGEVGRGQVCGVEAPEAGGADEDLEGAGQVATVDVGVVVAVQPLRELLKSSTRCS